MSKPTRYLLDTHVFAWIVLGTRVPKNLSHLEEAAGYGGLLVSAMTFWEIGMLAARDRLTLGMPCQDWIEQALKLPGLSVLELSPHVAVESSFLPGNPHGDPVDRILIASARVHNLTLATCDKKILAYGKNGYASVLAC